VLVRRRMLALLLLPSASMAGGGEMEARSDIRQLVHSGKGR
jgi:hypothetical protein